jgi:hypothetical protein
LLFYLEALGLKDSVARLQAKDKAAAATMPAWRAFREDLRACHEQITHLQSGLAELGYNLSQVRVLEVLIWIEAEARGYYREAQAKGLP